MTNKEKEFINSLKVIFPSAKEIHYIYDNRYNVLDKDYNILFTITNQLPSLERRDYLLNEM